MFNSSLEHILHSFTSRIPGPAARGTLRSLKILFRLASQIQSTATDCIGSSNAANRDHQLFHGIFWIVSEKFLVGSSIISPFQFHGLGADIEL